jgi:hypothetical protein
VTGAEAPQPTAPDGYTWWPVVAASLVGDGDKVLAEYDGGSIETVVSSTGAVRVVGLFERKADRYYVLTEMAPPPVRVVPAESGPLRGSRFD